jgi:hypothetical protein
VQFRLATRAIIVHRTANCRLPLCTQLHHSAVSPRECFHGSSTLEAERQLCSESIIRVTATSKASQRGTDPFRSSRSRPAGGLSLRQRTGLVAANLRTIAAAQKLSLIPVTTTSKAGRRGTDPFRSSRALPVEGLSPAATDGKGCSEFADYRRCTEVIVYTGYNNKQSGPAGDRPSPVVPVAASWGSVPAATDRAGCSEFADRHRCTEVIVYTGYNNKLSGPAGDRPSPVIAVTAS